MFNVFDTWQYRDHGGNCWDYVREWLIVNAGVHPDAVPRFGICPDDRRSMTNAANGVQQGFIEISEPEQNAIACHYRGRVLYHVGIVDNGMVRHTSRQRGTVIDTMVDYTRCSKTRFFKYGIS